MKKNASVLLTGLVILGLVSCSSNTSSIISTTTGTPSIIPTTSVINSTPAPSINMGPEENLIDDNYRNYYQIFVYSYYDSNGDKIGDLNGITSKLSYIRDLGYTGVWLSPIFPSSSLHKYNANNYYQIDPSFGTLLDFENLVKEAHSLGINVILDLALNHSSKNAEYFQKAVEAHEYAMNLLPIPDQLLGYEDFYVFYDTLQDAQDSRKTYYQVPGHSFYYEGNFDSDMPEFNFDSEFVWTEFDNIMTFWQEELGVDGFRLDAVKYYYYGNTSKNVEALSRINSIVKENDPTAYVVGECWDSKYVINSYYKSDLDSYFWFPGSEPNGSLNYSTTLNGANKHIYLSLLEDLIEGADGKIPAPFLDNHDMTRHSTSDLNKDKFIYGLLAMLNGTTFTYYGNEIGMGGSISNGNDANVRTHMDWSESNEGETNNPYNGTGVYNFAPVDEQLVDPNSLLNYYRLATRTRNAFPSIARGEIVDTYSATVKTDRQVRITKTYNDETIDIVFNFSTELDTYYETTKQLGSYLPVTGDIIKDGNSYKIPAYGIAVFK